MKAALENRQDRAMLGQRTLGWVHEYGNRAMNVRKDVLSSALEVFVQLRGHWTHDGGTAGRRTCGPGGAILVSPGETYGFAYQGSPEERGLQVGFALFPRATAEIGVDGELAFSPRAELDRRFFEFARAYQTGNDAGQPLPATEAHAEIVHWAKRNIEVVPADALLDAKRAIDASFASALYVKHFADIAGHRSPVVFSRAFAQRFGLTPIAYRIKLRLNEAARLTWAEPELAITDIARAVGFEDESYFHRAFVAEHGVTPAQYGRRKA